MRLQHYLGGLENLGPVNFFDKKVFMAEWEKRIFGIHTVMMAESTHLDNALPKYPIAQVPTTFKETWTWASLRTGAEGMQPFEYFKYRYYEKWLMGISQFFVDRGYIAAEELATLTEHYRANPDAPLPERPNPALKEQVVQVSPSRRLRPAHTGCSGPLYRRRHRLPSPTLRPPITPDCLAFYATRRAPSPKCTRALSNTLCRLGRTV